MMLERVKAWYNKAYSQGKRNLDALPQHIFFYRDGVSESQLAMVWDKELPQIRSACNLSSGSLQNLTASWSPSITLFVVTKRHHARFFPNTNPQEPSETAPNNIKDAWAENLKSGTLIDTKVVAPSRTEFYLQSHHNLIGTARSSYYILIQNESGLSLEELEEVVSYIPVQNMRYPNLSRFG